MSFTLAELQQFITPNGQQVLLDLVKRAHTERGRGWLEFLKTEYPKAADFFELVALDEKAALKRIKTDYPLLKFGTFDQQLIDFHRRVNAELNKPRGKK